MRQIGLDRGNNLDHIMLIAEKINELVNGFNQLRSDFDAQLEKMQEPETKRKMKEAFDASPEELGKAAVEAIKETTNGCDCQVRRGEKKKRAEREDLYETPLKNLQEVENDRRKNG